MRVVFSVCLVLCGLAIYTNLKIKSINNQNELASPLCLILSNLGGTPQEHRFLSAIIPNLGSSCRMERPFSPSRLEHKERDPQIILSLITQKQKNGTKIENFNPALKNSSRRPTTLNSGQPDSLIRERRFLNYSRPRPLHQRLNNFSPLLMKFTNEQPQLGYSFYLLWGGFLFHVFSLILGIINWKVSLSHCTLSERCVVV